MADMTERCGSCRKTRSVATTTRSTATRTGANCTALEMRLKQVEFALADVILYLDAYPNCGQALSYYHKLVDEREQLVAAINEQCGPVTNLGNVSTEVWSWIDGPWPWMIDAN